MQRISILLACSAVLAARLPAASHIFASLPNGPTSISRIDPATGYQTEVISTIPGVEALALSPQGRTALVLSVASNSVAFVDLVTGTVSDPIPLTGTPWQAFFNSAGTTAFVIGSDSTLTLHLFAVDVKTRLVLIDRQFPSLLGPVSVEDTSVSHYAVSPDGGLLYFLTESSSRSTSGLAVFELPSLLFSSFVSLGGTNGSQTTGFFAVLATPDGKELLLGGSTEDKGEYSDLVALYSTGTYQQIATAPFPGDLDSAAISADGALAYAACLVGDTFYLETVSLPSLEVTQGAKIKGYMTFWSDTALSADGSFLFTGSTIFSEPSGVVQVPAVHSLSSTVAGQFSPSSELWIVDIYSTELVVLEQGSSTVSQRIPFNYSPGPTLPGRPGFVYALPGYEIATVDANAGIVTGNVPVDTVNNPTFLAGGEEKLFVASDQTLKSYDPSSGQFTNIPLPQFGISLTIDSGILSSRSGKQIFVPVYQNSLGNANPCASCGELAIYGTSSNTLVSGLTINPTPGEDFQYPTAMAVSGTTLYVNTLPNNITAFDLTGESERKVFSFSTYAPYFQTIAVSPDGNTLYALAPAAASVFFINSADGSVFATIPASPTSNWMALTPDGAELYFSDTSNYLTVIDTTTQTETQVDIGSSANYISISKW